MFYRITKLGTQGVCFEGNMVEEWKMTILVKMKN